MSASSAALRELIGAPAGNRRLGPYRCEEILDQAGTAPVFRAIEEHGGHAIREVAIKVFDVSSAKGGRGSRVVDEARTLCRVQHPNVIRFHTIINDTERHLMGIVMELASGVSLDRQLASMPVGDARRVALTVDVAVSMASALAAAHEEGIVHCNLKPSNVMLTDGTYKLINFGISASLGEDGEAAKSVKRILPEREITTDAIGTKAAKLAEQKGPAIPGAVGYVDPVCFATTAAPTASSDLYSLGATLYECLIGRVPAAKSDGVDTKVLLGESPAPPLLEAPSEAPKELTNLVIALVAQDRADRPRSADAVRREVERIRSALAGRTRKLPPEERGPFPGLDRYEASDRDVFLGRTAEIAGVLELCRTRGLVGVVGLSGSGKSSLTRAGVLPAIEEGALGGWPSKYRSLVVTPGKDLMAALEDTLGAAIGSPLAKHPQAVAEQLAANVEQTGEGLVVLVDQLEEIVIKSEHPETQVRALDLLARSAQAAAGVRVVVVVRRDLLDGVLAIDPLFSRTLSRGVHHLGPLGAAAWEEVLDQSIDAYGYRLESADLRGDILAAVKDRDGAMTLAQAGLARLWAARDAKTKTIPRAAFDAKDGMKNALEEQAESAISGVAIDREKLRKVLLSLTTPDGGRAHVTLETLVGRFGASAKDVLFALTKVRLVASEREGFTFVHDAVLREWKLLRGWLDDARDDRVLSAHLERDAERWAASRDPAELWRKGRLAAALEMWKRGAITPTDDVRAFLTKSANEAAKVRVAFGFLVSLVVLLTVGGSLIYAKQSRESAEQAHRDAQALAAALAEVKTLKAQTEENAMEQAATAKLLAELRTKTAAQVQTAVKKVEAATNLEGARKATDELKAQAPAPNVPLPLDLSSIGAGNTGPRTDVAGPSPTGGGAFDQTAIERVVNTRKAGVKRTCLDRNASTAASTKVSASLTIAPNGSVQNVTTTGDDPAIAKCIEQQLRSWTFPAPGETKTVQIPFVFVRQ